MAAEPIFVLGSPRSGTTLTGAWLGTHPLVYALGEYSAFVMAYASAPDSYSRIRPAYAPRYLRELQDHAAGFAARLAAEHGARYYCDATPWNLMIAPVLAEQFPAARFVLTVRHYRGVIQSLERSYQRGYLWAGASPVERAEVWAALYGHAAALPPERTAVFGYDRLCADPVDTVACWREELSRIGLDPGWLDDRAFCDSHAGAPGEPRRTVAIPAGNGVRFAPIHAYDPSRWSDENDAEVRPVVAEVDAALRRYPAYATTPPAVS